MKTSPLLAVLVIVAAGCGTSSDDRDATESSPAAATSVARVTSVAPVTSVARVTSVAPVTSVTSAPASTAPDAVSGGDTLDLPAAFIELAGTPDDGPFYMVNFYDYADIADYPADSEWTGSSGEEANERYGRQIIPTALDAGAEFVFAGDVAASTIDGEVEWDHVNVTRYPSRQAFIDLQRRDDFRAAFVHYEAAIANGVSLASDPLPISTPPEADPSKLAFPSTEDDPPFMMVHLMDFNETAEYEPGDEPDDWPFDGREAVSRYGANASDLSVELGVSPGAWFTSFATVLGDSDDWDEVRINVFPSRAAFDALTSDPHWESGLYHRTAGLAETYALQVDPDQWDPDLVAR